MSWGKNNFKFRRGPSRKGPSDINNQKNSSQFLTATNLKTTVSFLVFTNSFKCNLTVACSEITKFFTVLFLIWYKNMTALYPWRMQNHGNRNESAASPLNVCVSRRLGFLKYCNCRLITRVECSPGIPQSTLRLSRVEGADLLGIWRKAAFPCCLPSKLSWYQSEMRVNQLGPAASPRWCYR